MANKLRCEKFATDCHSGICVQHTTLPSSLKHPLKNAFNKYARTRAYRLWNVSKKIEKAKEAQR